MFTGIVTDIGQVLDVQLDGDLRARIGTRYDAVGIDIGASIACDGVCLTVVALAADSFDVQISAETVSKTNIGRMGWPVGRRLNLERALRVGDDLGGPRAEGPNDLEPAALEVAPELARWRDHLGDATGQTPVLAGSGGTWFVEGAFAGEGLVVVHLA